MTYLYFSSLLSVIKRNKWLLALRLFLLHSKCESYHALSPQMGHSQDECSPLWCICGEVIPALSIAFARNPVRSVRILSPNSSNQEPALLNLCFIPSQGKLIFTPFLGFLAQPTTAHKVKDECEQKQNCKYTVPTPLYAYQHSRWLPLPWLCRICEWTNCA